MPQTVVADILAHARAEAPRECCGLLVGNGDRIERSVRARNLHADPSRYLIDPEDHFATIRVARAEGREVIGAYHSHPAHPSIPSATDIAEAGGGPEFFYVIVSLLDGEIRAYQMANGVCTRKPLVFSP